MRNVDLRLCRINDGRYRIGLYEDPEGEGRAGAPIWTTEKDLTRFEILTLPVPPRQSLVLKVELLESHQRPERLPDLVIDPWEAHMNDGKVSATIHNLGNGEAENVTVQLRDGDRILQEKVIPLLAAPTDFVPKRINLSFDRVSASKKLMIVIDPENKIREILEENNTAEVKMRPARQATLHF